MPYLFLGRDAFSEFGLILVCVQYAVSSFECFAHNTFVIDVNCFGMFVALSFDVPFNSFNNSGFHVCVVACCYFVWVHSSLVAWFGCVRIVLAKALSLRNLLLLSLRVSFRVWNCEFVMGGTRGF